MKIGTATTQTAITIGSLDNIVVNATFNVNNTVNKYYDITGVTPATPSILSANYYDTYNFNTKDDFTKLGYNPQAGYGTQYTTSSKGLLTGSITALLEGSGKYHYTSMYYDYRGNLIQTKSTNHLDGVESEYISYTFAGSPT